MQHHLFIMDPLERLNHELDSSLRMMTALDQLGHAVYFCAINELSWVQLSTEKKDVQVTCRRFSGESLTQYRRDNDTSVFPAEQLSGIAWSALHMRKDPPYNMSYVETTWLMDRLMGPQTKSFNHPRALRDYSEKLVHLIFFPEYCAPAMVSRRSVDLAAFFLETCAGDGIIKPLDLFGGRGVERLERAEKSESEVLKLFTGQTKGDEEIRLLQPFNNQIYKGEIRAFAAFGEPISWCLKVPKPGQYLANTRAGATLESYTPSDKVYHMVKDVSERLIPHGVYLTGFDIIGETISEINITSPRMLVPDVDQEVELYGKLAKLMEKHCDGAN